MQLGERSTHGHDSGRATVASAPKLLLTDLTASNRVWTGAVQSPKSMPGAIPRASAKNRQKLVVNLQTARFPHSNVHALPELSKD